VPSPGSAWVKRDLTFAVDPSLYPHIKGTTDSEVLFHLALTLGLQEDPIVAMAKAIQAVESAGHEHGVKFPMQGTVAVSDGITVWAFRYSSQRQTRTLFHSADIATLEQMYPDTERLRVFGKRAHVVVFEPLNDLPGPSSKFPSRPSRSSMSPATTTTFSWPTNCRRRSTDTGTVHVLAGWCDSPC
jgi:predicted glutamine amidotransferase